MILLNTSKGQIKIELDEQNTPVTAANFKKYVDKKHYDNTIFHRVIKNFMIQGGGMDADMNEKDTDESIANEAKQGAANTRGTIAMARLPDPHSASAQFFINTVDNPFLNFSSETQEGFGYCVFGKVVEGMEVVDEIAKAKTTFKDGHADVPEEPIVIESAVSESE